MLNPMWRHLLQAFSARVHPRRCESQHGVEQSATTSPMSSCGQASRAQLEVTVAEKTACEKRPRDERQAALAEPPMVVQLEKAIEAQCLVDGVAGAMNSSRLACGVVHHKVDRACPLPPREAEAQSQWLLLRHPVGFHLWMGLEGAVASGLWEIAGGEASQMRPLFRQEGIPVVFEGVNPRGTGSVCPDVDKTAGEGWAHPSIGMLIQRSPNELSALGDCQNKLADQRSIMLLCPCTRFKESVRVKHSVWSYLGEFRSYPSWDSISPQDVA